MAFVFLHALCLTFDNSGVRWRRGGAPTRLQKLTNSDQLGDGEGDGLMTVQDSQQHDDSLVRCHGLDDCFDVFEAAVGHLYFVAGFEQGNRVSLYIELLAQGVE